MHSRRILIVEDDLDMQEVFQRFLKRKGFSVIVASNGHEGLYLAEAGRPDLIVTDIRMPELDGISLIKEWRSQAEFDNTPIIAITAYGSGDLNLAIRAGANRGIRKPPDLDSLVIGIKELLAESGKN